jgi:nucleoid-associated protein EbfC
MNMQSIMAQAQKMQREIMQKKDEINKMNFTGHSEMVEVEMSGKKEVIKVTILNKENFEKDDLDALEDMIQIALNDALSQIDAETNRVMGAYSGALNGML